LPEGKDANQLRGDQRACDFPDRPKRELISHLVKDGRMTSGFFKTMLVDPTRIRALQLFVNKPAWGIPE